MAVSKRMIHRLGYIGALVAVGVASFVLGRSTANPTNIVMTAAGKSVDQVAQQASGRDCTGFWDLSIGGDATIAQEGNSVAGTFNIKGGGGTIEGTLDGTTVTFTLHGTLFGRKWDSPGRVAFQGADRNTLRGQVRSPITRSDMELIMTRAKK
jgi:hypothetical protein